MKLIIAGGRDYHGSVNAVLTLNKIRLIHNVKEVVSGAADGADKLGERWATSCGLPTKRFPANWDLHGRSAGPRRNAEMAAYADALAIFPGGRGSSNMLEAARKRRLTIFDLRNPKIY